MTEKNYNPKQKEKKAIKKQDSIGKTKKPVETLKKIKEKKQENKRVKQRESGEKQENVEVKQEKKIKKHIPKIKKTQVVAKGVNLPISTKDAKFVCKFIVKKRIGDAIRDLEKVKTGKKAVPMKGEIPHQKGKRMSSGRFPKKAAEKIKRLLKSLAANATEGNLEEPIIVEAIANIGERPYGRFGRTRKKRTHVKIIAKDKIKQEVKK